LFECATGEGLNHVDGRDKPGHDVPGTLGRAINPPARPKA
jgi:hypothetical protein